MEAIITTPEQLESAILNAFKKINFQETKEPEQPKNLGAEEARKLLSDTLGCPVSKSKFYKDSMKGVLPVKGKAGKWLVFDRNELLIWAEKAIKSNQNNISDRVATSARRK